MASGAFIMGQEVAGFENAFAAFTGTQQAISCNSGTDALLLILEGPGEIGRGDEVITTLYSFFSTAECNSPGWRCSCF